MKNSFLCNNNKVAIQPDNIKINMFDYQLTTLYYAQLMESNKINYRKGNSNFCTKFGVIGNSSGSGKSIICLALLNSDNIHIYDKKIEKTIGNNLFVKYKLNEYNNFSTNIIVVPKHILNQWKNYIDIQTNFEYTTIYETKDLDKHFPNFITKSVKNTKILILKDDSNQNTQIQSIQNQTFQNENNQNLFTKYLNNFFNSKIVLLTSTYFNILNNSLDYYNIQDNINVNRIFFDEADNLEISSSNIINANFYWFITSNIDTLKNPFSSLRYVKSSSNPNIVRYKVSKEGSLLKPGFIKNLFEEIYNLNENINVYLNCDLDYIDNSIQRCIIINKDVKLKSPFALKLVQKYVDSNLTNIIKEGNIYKALEIIRCHKGNQTNIIDVFSEKIKDEINDQEKKLNYIESNKKALYNPENIKQLKDKILYNKTRLNEIENKVKGKNICPISNDIIENQTFCPHCKNIFEFSQIIRWVTMEHNCPLCRKELNTNELILLDNNADNFKNENTDKYITLINILKDIEKNNKNYKLIIYTDYEFITNNIKLLMKEKNIKYFSFDKNKKNIISHYINAEKSILIINNMNDIIGLNLIETTDIIILHNINKINENRLIGSAARIGKQDSLTIWRINYEDNLT